MPVSDPPGRPRPRLSSSSLPLPDQRRQNAIQPANRNQLAKVKLAANARFPLNQKVNVTRPLPRSANLPANRNDVFGIAPDASGG